MRISPVSVVLFSLFFVADALAGDPAFAPKERLEDTWDLSTVYPDVAAWEAALAKSKLDADALAACKGQLATKLRPCLEQRFAVQKDVSRVAVYAMNLSNADTRDGIWQARSQQAQQAYIHFESAASFFPPEIIALGSTAVEAAIKDDPALAPYDYFLRSTVVNAPHTLDAAGEGLLASAGSVLAGADNVHGILINAELPWPEVSFSDGTKVKLNPSAFTKYRVLPNRDDRKKAFDAYYGALQGFESVTGATLGASTEGHWFTARARKYETSVAAAVDSDHVPPEVYRTLVTTTNKNLPTLHRYLKLRAKILGVSDLAYHDLYVPLVKSARSFTVDEAEALTLAAVKPLGKEYSSAMEAGFGARWTDVYPREGKRGGAYMDGSAYAVHPFMLLNYNNDYESVSTFAHEWGHAMHSVFSAKNQPYAKADYATFIAEIASTFNESLLLQAMLKSSKSDDDKLFYLGSQLENLRTTYFRQAQFAEFELAIHEQVEKGNPLTGEALSATYLDILKRYYGADAGVTAITERDAIEWSYIPHFYYNFYVYQYATSIAASSQLSADVLAKKPGALERYITLLSAGGSDDPYDLLKTAGVDLATPEPYDALAKQMNDVMDQMESLLAKQEKEAQKKAPKSKP